MGYQCVASARPIHLLSILVSQKKSKYGSSLVFLCAERNQIIIAENGAVKLLANTAKDAADPQTLCMVAGALANLCGNGKVVS